MKDEDEDELETQRGPSPKRVKAEEPFAWVKNEDGAEIIILDDDEEVSLSVLFFKLKRN